LTRRRHETRIAAVELYEYCVYTIRHSKELAHVAATGGSASYQEGKPWVTACRLLEQATPADERMPVLFSAADDWSGLIFWGLLTDIDVYDGDAARGIKPSTTFSFEHLTPIVPERRLSDLRLRSNGERLADRDIYPYRICITPSFL
jgi:hypothetical protein